MNIEKLVEMQKKLDNRIYQKFGLCEQSTFEQRKLALIVELAELANEVRCFKFWSVKSASKKDVILEEYVDCLHFVISLGITINVDFSKVEISTNIKSKPLTNKFLEIISMSESLTVNNPDTFYTLFINFVELAYSLEFSTNDIYNAYLKKNELNHTRQSNNY